MIEKLEISDYRSCMHTTINLQPDLSVLIGPNGSGKTNILNACLLLRSLENCGEQRHQEFGSAANKCRLKATFKCDSKKSILTADVQLRTDENNADVILGSKQSWYAKDYTKKGARIPISLGDGVLISPSGTSPKHLQRNLRMHYAYPKYSGNFLYEPSRRKRQYYLARQFASEMADDSLNSFLESLVKIEEFLSGIKYYSASQFTNPSLCPVSFEIEQEGERHRGVQLQGHTRFLYDLYSAWKTGNHEQFFNVIGPDGVGLVDNVDFVEILTSSIEHKVRSGGEYQQRKIEKILVIPQFTIGRNKLSPSQLSEGTFKTITLLFYIMTEQSSALLIEEPEVCVHHGLLSSIIELIKTYSKQKQIIVSTHSDFVLDQIEPRNVYKVSRTAELGTEVTQITKSMSSQDLATLTNYLMTEGNLGEYWRDGGFD